MVSLREVHMIRPVLLLLISPILAAGQAPQLPDSALLQVGQALRDFGTGASIHESSVMKITNRLVSSAGCTATFEMNTSHEVGSSHQLYTVNLAKMSPDVGVQKWVNDSLWSVTADNTSGQPDIETKREMVVLGQRQKSKDPSRKLELTLTDESQSRRVQTALSQAIVACDGVKRDSTTQARVKSEDSTAAAKNKKASGMGTSDSTYAPLKQRCRDMLRPTLKNPDSAIFPPDTSTLAFGDEKHVTVMMAVKAQNDFGAMVRMPMSCIFVKYGNAWVPAK